MHVYEVTSISRQSARTTRAKVDLVVAGARPHDIGKLESYEIGPGGFTTWRPKRIVHPVDEASAKATDRLYLVADNELFRDGREISDKTYWRLERRIRRRPHGWE